MTALAQITPTRPLEALTIEQLWLRYNAAQRDMATADERYRRGDDGPANDDLWSDADRESDACLAELRRRVQSAVGEVPLQELCGALL